MTTVTLVYDCDVGAQNPAALATRIGAIPLNEGTFPNNELGLLGMSINSDTTAAVAGTNTVRRTVVLFVGVDGHAHFPTDEDKKAATRQLYTDRLAKLIPARVTAAEPVVAP